MPSNGGNESSLPKPAPRQVAREQQATPVPAEINPQPILAQPAPENTVAASSATGMWAVQLGSFENQENAERLAADLRKLGYAAFLSQVMTDIGQSHRVRLAPQEGRDAAEAMAAALEKTGYDGRVVSNP